MQLSLAHPLLGRLDNLRSFGEVIQPFDRLPERSLSASHPAFGLSPATRLQLQRMSLLRTARPFSVSFHLATRFQLCKLDYPQREA
jgi:hypothetical protein